MISHTNQSNEIYKVYYYYWLCTLIEDVFNFPRAKEYCLAKFENVWYRARVEEIVSDDKFLVVYIDFTNEKEVSSDSIRRYPMSLDFACCTTLCGIDGMHL